MAIRYAVATGNWSSTATWDGGTLPTSADDVYANNFTVTINQNVTVVSLNTTATTGVVAGGTFSPNGSYTIVCNTINAGSSNCVNIGIASSIISITANSINGATSPLTGGGVRIDVPTTQVIINGNINGYQGVGLQLNNVLSCTVNGNAIANGSSTAIVNFGIGTVVVNGFVQGSTSQVGFNNNNNSTLINYTITKAITINNGFAAVVNGFTLPSITVKEIEQGVFGQVPIQGYVRLSTASGAFYKGATTGLGTRTLTDVADIAGQVPAQSDVRFGVTYQSGAKTGSAYIPAASSVGFGVPVDNTTGTAALTPASVWNAATSSLTTSGSIGERLKNASTVDTTGDQLAALL